MRACRKDITKIITAELKDLLGVEELPIICKPLVKRPPIDGLKIIRDLFICGYDGCSSGFTTKDSLRKHRSGSHKNPTSKPARGTHRTGYCQTLYLNPATYFEVDHPIPLQNPPTLESTFDLSTFLHNRKAEILHDQHPKHLPADPQLIPPVFVELGFYTFIKSLDQSSISAHMNCERHGLFSLLRKLALQCFEDDCTKLGPASNVICRWIMGPLP